MSCGFSEKSIVRHHFLREHVENGQFEISHEPSKYQHADFLTPLAKDSFRFHRNFMMNMSRYLIGGALEVLVFF